jgi:hypothetical protein
MVILGGWVFLMSEVPMYTVFHKQGRNMVLLAPCSTQGILEMKDTHRPSRVVLCS